EERLRRLCEHEAGAWRWIRALGGGKVKHRFARPALGERAAPLFDIALGEAGVSELLLDPRLQHLIAKAHKANQDRNRCYHQAATDPPRSPSSSPARLHERKLSLAQRCTVLTAQPALQLNQHIVPPDQPTWASTVMPLARCSSDLIAHPRTID